MNVIRLDDYRRRPAAPCCPRSDLDAFAQRIQQSIDASASLLLPVSVLEAVLDDLRSLRTFAVAPASATCTHNHTQEEVTHR